MQRKEADSSASDVSALGHSNDSNKSKIIAIGAAKVFNRIILKSRPSTIKTTGEEVSARFQIVHLPDRSPVTMSLSEIPTTNEEYDAAISRMKAQTKLRGELASVEHKGITASGIKGTQQLPPSKRYVVEGIGQLNPEPLSRKDGTGDLNGSMDVTDERDSSLVPRTVVATSGSTTTLLGRMGAGPLEKPRRGLNTPERKPSVRVYDKVRPNYARRVASDGVPPRPLSERALLSSGMHTRPSPRAPHGSASTPNTHMVLPALGNIISRKEDGHAKNNSDEKRSNSRPLRQRGVDRAVASSGENNDSNDEPSRLVVPSAKHILASRETKSVQSTGDNAAQAAKKSEYEDDTDFEDRPLFSPEKTEHSPVTPPVEGKRRHTRYPRPRERSGSWSQFSSVSQLQQLASRSASTSPTPHVAMELKVVPPQDIKIRTVSSPTRTNAADGRSALQLIQQAMSSRRSAGPGGQDRDAIRLGKVRSGEIRRVDYPDIIKAKPPAPNGRGGQTHAEEQRLQSRDSFGNWLKYYAEEGKNRERISAVPATSGTYDRVTSIYDIYASLEDT
ncbi:hypothetical protein J7T55_003608 [Diaporthe amygdali]|uniref:uncharacterized protein n=1 Tax=Phomopsis amygdali TaxID=1214568 RepID=UPI0022FE0C6A|nr:uncharacterized protein J7T55_003608 [Diaporthe amygdali]KAJ0117191.1 hypothetical protein J7T55_003608 [Diaporthe amygdali]